MNVKNVSSADFFSNFKSTEELLQMGQAGQSSPTPAPVNTENPINPQESPITPSPVEEKSTEELLSGAAEPKEENQGEGKAPNPDKLPETFATLIKTAEDQGLLVGFADGKYETAEDFIALLKANKENERTSMVEEIQKEVFESFPPAMKAVLHYAKLGVQDPKDLIPYLTAVDNLQYSAELSADVPEHREQIILNALMIQGLSREVAEAELADLKTQGDARLEQRSKALKPVLDNYNKAQVERLYREKLEAQTNEINFWRQNSEEVRDVLTKSPDINGLKITKEHKQLAYSFLAAPDPATGELPIYNVIDSLLEKKDFGTLTEMVLLALDKKNYRKYISSSVAEKQAERTERALRTQTTHSPIEGNPPAQKGLARPTEYKRPSL